MLLLPSTMVMVAVWPFTPALPAVAVPEIVTPAAASALLMILSPATGDVIAIVGAAVARVKFTAVLLPVLPAASVSWATMLLLPLPASVTKSEERRVGKEGRSRRSLVHQLTESNSVTVDANAASPAVTV